MHGNRAKFSIAKEINKKNGLLLNYRDLRHAPISVKAQNIAMANKEWEKQLKKERINFSNLVDEMITANDDFNIIETCLAGKVF